MKKVKDWIEEIGENKCEKCGELKKEHSFSSIGSGYLICPTKNIEILYKNNETFPIRGIRFNKEISFFSNNIILKASDTFVIKDIPGELAKNLFELLKNGIEKLDEEELNQEREIWKI